jgi:hypothetical protein
MNSDDEKIRKMLRETFPPVDDAGPRLDLWPAVLRRLDDSRARVPWYDWALAAVLLVWALLFPGGLSVLVYHL